MMEYRPLCDITKAEMARYTRRETVAKWAVVVGVPVVLGVLLHFCW